MAKIRKLTPAILRNIVLNEKLSGKLEPIENVEAEEVDADKLGQSLEHHVDHVKILKLEEERLTKRLRNIREAKRRLHKKILKGL